MGTVPSRVLSGIVGVAAFATAGLVIGGNWWIAAGAGIAAVVASQFDHRMTYSLVVATLATVAGAAAEERDWLVVAVVAGTIASVELAAAADRVNLVRPRVPVLTRVTGATVVAAAIAAGVVFVGGLDTSLGQWAAVVAAAAAVTALRLLVR